MTTPLTLLYRLQTDTNLAISSENMESVLNAASSIPDLPLHTFCVPEGLSVITEGLPETEVEMSISPIWSPPYSPLLVRTIRPASPIKPLHPEHIEIAIIWYKRTRERWLVQTYIFS
jgi:hypothetical protein